MHRVRVGLIGLSSVFLLVALAAALLNMTGSDGVTNTAAAVPAAAGKGDGVPTEPLAQLGVAPGNVGPSATGPGAPVGSHRAAPVRR